MSLGKRRMRRWVRVSLAYFEESVSRHEYAREKAEHGFTFDKTFIMVSSFPGRSSTELPAAFSPYSQTPLVRICSGRTVSYVVGDFCRGCAESSLGSSRYKLRQFRWFISMSNNRGSELLNGSVCLYHYQVHEHLWHWNF